MSPEIRETDLAFRFGFLLHEKTHCLDTNFLAAWHFEEIDRFHLYSHPECELTQYTTSSGRALVLGDHFVCAGSESLERVMASFVDKTDWDALDLLSGRFAMLVLRPNRKCILQDPFGARTLYYHAGAEVCIASHAALAATALGLSVDKEFRSFTEAPEYKRRGTVYLPGNITMYREVKGLTPNCYYDLETRKTARFWPRRPRETTSYAHFLDIADAYFTRFAEFLRIRYHPILGLTGGVDTRSLIAGLWAKGVRPDLMTWAGFPENEKPAIEEMRAHLGLPHTYIDSEALPKPVSSGVVLNATRRANGFSRGKSRLALAMRPIAKRQSGTVFVKGHGGEILRGFYNSRLFQKGKRPEEQSLPEIFSRLYLTKAVRHPSKPFEIVVDQAFRAFAEDADYGAPLFGHDVLDLFYWEHRMGTWGANKLNETDPIIRGLIGFNSRPLYAAAFGLPPEERFGPQLLLDMTARYDAALSKIGAPSRGQRTFGIEEEPAWPATLTAGGVPTRSNRKPGEGPSRVIVHGGFRKAGSTSMQSLLRQNRETLRPHLWMSIRGEPTRAFRRGAMRYVRSRDAKWMPRLREAALELRAATATAKGRVAVISDENLIGSAVYHEDGTTLFDWAAEILPLIEEAFEDLPLEFYFMTREPGPWLRSAYNQEVRNSRQTKTYEKWHAELPMKFDWERGGRHIAEALRSNATFVDMQTEIATHGVLGLDLLSRLGFSQDFLAQLEIPSRANAGFSEEAIDFMREVNRSSLSQRQIREIRALVYKHRSTFERG